MEKKRINVSLTDEAMRLLEKYSGPRGRGEFISRLIVDYDRYELEGGRMIAALRENARQGELRKSGKRRR